jgi:hypothetical protein
MKGRSIGPRRGDLMADPFGLPGHVRTPAGLIVPGSAVPLQPEPPQDRPRPWGQAHQPSYAISGVWTPARVRAALDANDAGDFAQIAQLRSSVTRDPRIGGQGGARGQRVSTPLGLAFELCLPEGYDSSDLRSPAARIRDAAAPLYGAEGALGYSFQAFLEGENVDFGIGFATLTWEPSGGGGTWLPRAEPWPIDAVRLDTTTGCYMAAVEGGEEVITPGDGRWVMISATAYRPFEEGAQRNVGDTFLSRAWGKRDANRFSEAAGQNPLIATVPKGADPNERAAFERDSRALTTGKQGLVKWEGYEVERLGSEVEHVRVFSEIIALGATEIAIAFLGQDGTAAQGKDGTYGAKKVLDGVRYDLVERDVMALAAANAQILVPFAYYNYGRAALAPRARWLVPDPEEEARHGAEREEARKARAAFWQEIGQARTGGAELTRELVLEISTAHGVELSPAMAESIAEGMKRKAEQSAQAAAAFAA